MTLSFFNFKIFFFATLLGLFLSSGLIGQTTKYFGFNANGSYLSNDLSIIDRDFSDHVGLGAEGFFRLSFGKKEKTSIRFGLGYLYNYEAGNVNGGLGTDRNGRPIEAVFTNNFLSAQIMFGWKPFDFRNHHLFLEVGASTLAYVSGSGEVFSDEIFYSRISSSEGILPGLKTAIAYETSIIKSYLSLRTSLGYTYFFETNTIESVFNLGLGVVWQIQKPRGRGLF
jgi:hypothetical protein